MILQCISSNVAKNLLIICPYPPLPPPHNRPLATAPYCFHSGAGQRSRLRSKYRLLIVFLITVLMYQKGKIPAWYCLEDEVVMFFDSTSTFESKLRWHRLFLAVESTRGIRTLVVVFELLEEMVAIGCRNGTFNKPFSNFAAWSESKVHLNAFVCISDDFRSTCSICIC